MLKSVDEHRLAADIEHEEKQLKVRHHTVPICLACVSGRVIDGVGQNRSEGKLYIQCHSGDIADLWSY
jgi:hypothetical protein